MEEQTIHYEVPEPSINRLSIFRLLWWIPQYFIIGVWQFLLAFVLIFQFLHILVTGRCHEWSREFTRKFAYHVYAWVRYIFWATDEQPRIIEY